MKKTILAFLLLILIPLAHAPPGGINGVAPEAKLPESPTPNVSMDKWADTHAQLPKEEMKYVENASPKIYASSGEELNVKKVGDTYVAGTSNTKEAGLNNTLFFLLFVIGIVGVLISIYAMHHLKMNKQILTSREQIGKDYVQKCRKAKFSQAQIKSQLITNGYTYSEIESIMRK